MKKYLPSLDELIPGVIILIVGLAVWQLVSKPINDALAKLKPAA